MRPSQHASPYNTLQTDKLPPGWKDLDLEHETRWFTPAHDRAYAVACLAAVFALSVVGTLIEFVGPRPYLATIAALIVCFSRFGRKNWILRTAAAVLSTAATLLIPYPFGSLLVAYSLVVYLPTNSPGTFCTFAPYRRAIPSLPGC